MYSAMRITHGIIAMAVALLWAGSLYGQTGASHSQFDTRRHVVIEDFEAYTSEDLPTGWMTNRGRGNLVPVSPDMMNDQERYVIKEENGNTFVRAMMNDEAHRLVLLNGRHFDWDVNEYPNIRWDWRANKLPEGAREDQRSKNDTGAAFYVTFGRDWLGRPKSIKYSYSSTLPAGTTDSQGALRIIVVASEPEDGTGEWMTMERNVVEDYRRLFGSDPPNRPIGIILWSDSDTMNTTAEADFDNIILLSDFGQ